MQVNIEKLAVRLGEGFLASGLSLDERRLNAFYREVYLHKGADMSFINGIAATGLRSSAYLTGNELETNIANFRSASRRLLPLVIHTSSRPSGSNETGHLNTFGHIYQLANTGCFVLVAGSAQEDLYLTLIAHRITELSLVPGMVVAAYETDGQDIEVPDDQLIKQYLGDPDDQIPAPTPGQEIIFGKVRRRVPNWYNLDSPVMSGVAKDGDSLAFEAAARREYIFTHLEEIIDQAYSEFEALTGMKMSQVHISGVKNPQAIITMDSRVFSLADQDSWKDQRTDLIRISRLFPLPENQLREAVSKRKAVTLIEPVQEKTAFDLDLFTRIKAIDPSGHSKWYHALGRGTIRDEDVLLAIEHMKNGKGPEEYYLGIPFTKASGQFPKHDILLRDIERLYPDISDRSVTAEPDKKKASGGQAAMPLSLRAYQDHGANFTRLSRFYADTAFFYATGREEETVADPFQAVPAVPVSTAGMFSEAQEREAFPAFSPEKCTACGDCYIYCPHSAVRPLAISASQLVNAGIGMASKKGTVITKLTPMVRHFDKFAGQLEQGNGTSAGTLLPLVFEKVAGQMKLEGEDLEKALSEFEAVLAEVGALPVALTETLFTKPETIEKGTGEFFTLAFDTASCTACGICAEVCEYDAIEMIKQEQHGLSQAETVYQLWEQLPDTSGETINKLYHDPDYSPFAALMLSRNYSMTMTGGDPGDEGGPHKAMMHWVTSNAEAVVQLRYLDMIRTLDGLIDKITENIHKKLTKALPKDNLEQLSRTLDEARGKRMSLKEIIGQAEDEPGSLIDSNDMRRKTHLLDELKTLKWVMHEGPGGVGRSRYGMLLAAEVSMPWARSFPRNHFSAPAIVHWSGSAAAEALGLFYGNLRFVLDQIKLIRRAELEAKDKYDPATHDLQIAGLNWDQLTEEERQLVPPVLVVADRKDVQRSGWNSLNRLLADRYPIKVVLFDSVAPAGNEEIANLAVAEATLLSAIALKNAFVYRGGPGNVEHLYEGLMEGLSKTRPALFMLYVTDPFKHSMEMGNWSHYASLAANSRTFPAVIFDPEKDEENLAGLIDLAGNEAMLEDWVEEEIRVDEDTSMKYTVTWADWAFTQKDWKDEFTDVEDNSVNLAVAEYLALEPGQREGRRPVIIRSDGEKQQYYAASDRVIAMTGQVLSNWRTLQELAGLRSEFPDKLKNQLAEEYEKKLADEAAKLEKEYKDKLKAMEDGQAEVLRQRLKERLMALSRMAKNEVEN